MLRLRIVTALLLGSSLIAIICLGPPWLFSLFLVLCIFAGAWEWAGLSGAGHVMARSVYGIILVVMMLFLNGFLPPAWLEFVVMLGVGWWVIAMVMVFAYQRDKQPETVNVPLKLAFGILVLIPATISLLVLYKEQQGVEYLLLFFLLIWLVDSTAYFSGRHFGKHRLASRVSPGKSWEGVMGSLLAAVIMAAGYVLFSAGPATPDLLLVPVFLLTAIFSVAGDLFESMLKRYAGVKDSGRLLPGHGGVLDRIDSMTAAAPVFVLGVSMLGGKA